MGARFAMSSTTAQASESSSLISSNWLWRSLGVPRRNQPGRYTLRLVSILAMLIVQPIFVRHSLAQAFTLVTISFVLLSAMSTLNISRTYFLFGIIVALPALIAAGYSSSSGIKRLK